MAENDTTQDETAASEPEASEVVDVTNVETVESEDVAHDEDHYDGEHPGNLAIKVLLALGIFVGGGVIALWGAPKLAPHLPAGMAPVAAWLTPGSQKDAAEMDVFKNDISERIASLPVPLSSSEIDQLINQRVSTAQTDLTHRLDTLETRPSPGVDPTIETRLAALETKTEGTEAELESLLRQISEVTAAGGAISSDTNAQIATYSSALDGIKAQVTKLISDNALLSQKISAVVAKADRQAAETRTREANAAANLAATRKSATISDALDAIGRALASGAPFDKNIAALSDVDITIPSDLSAHDSGVVTMMTLREGFAAAAHDAIRADLLNRKDDSLMASIGNFLQAQVATRSLTPQSGNSTDAILSRAEDDLVNNRLADALAELETLGAAEKSGEMAGWMAQASERLKVETAYGALVSALQPE